VFPLGNPRENGETAQGRPRLSALLPEFLHQESAAPAHQQRAHTGTAVRVPRVQLHDVCDQFAETARSVAHRRETVQVRGVRLFNGRPQHHEEAQDETHWPEKLRVPAVQLLVHTSLIVQETPEDQTPGFVVACCNCAFCPASDCVCVCVCVPRLMMPG